MNPSESYTQNVLNNQPFTDQQQAQMVLNQQATLHPPNKQVNIGAQQQQPGAQQMNVQQVQGSNNNIHTPTQTAQSHQNLITDQQLSSLEVHSATRQPWHENINTDMRKHLVKKIIQTILQLPDDNTTMRDNRLTSFIEMAKKIEREMYENARDQDEYFHLLAQKIYRIQKEFEEKRNQRRQQLLQQQQQQQQQQSTNNPNNKSSILNSFDPDECAGLQGPPNK